MILLEKKVAVLIRNKLNSMVVLDVIFECPVRHRHNETRVDELIRIHQLINVFDCAHFMRLIRIKVINYSVSSNCNLQQIIEEIQFILFNVPCFDHCKVGFWHLGKLDMLQHVLFYYFFDGYKIASILHWLNFVLIILKL